jgi:hypothetical protein
VTEYRKWHSPTNYTRVCYDVTGTQHLATDTGDPECKSSVATEHYDEGMTYKLCETCYPESGVSCDSAAAQWLADYEYAIETDPHTTANDIGALAERAVAVIRAQQAELRDVTEHLSQAVTQRHEALLRAEQVEAELAALKAKGA